MIISLIYQCQTTSGNTLEAALEAGLFSAVPVYLRYSLGSFSREIRSVLLYRIDVKRLHDQIRFETCPKQCVSSDEPARCLQNA